MLRPPRRANRFQGTSVEIGTTLSNPYAEADGRRMRRRYACYAAVCVALIVGIVMLSTKNGGHGGRKSKTKAPTAPKGSYTMESQATISEVDAKVTMYKHAKSGMQIMTMIPSDTTQDAVFGISFRTKSSDDTGVAYITELCVQDGSENYPVKDPFNQLERASLQTYMESWTDRDRTAYVYASRNKVDFHDSVQVYLDAVFKPNMLHDEYNWIFRQEGWRVYMDFVDDSSSQQVRKLAGNAITAAKARQMNPQEAHNDYVYQKIYKGHPLAWMPMGDFRDIVTLTRSAMRDYYQKYYHPTNAQAFCFGPEDFVTECLNVMEPYLSEYTRDDKKRADSAIPWLDLEKLEDIVERVPYPSYQDANDFRLAMSYVLNDQPMDARTKMSWLLINELLVGSSASSIARLNAESSLGDDIIGILDNTHNQWVLTMGMSGIKDESTVAQARTALENKIAQVATEGFSAVAIQAALNVLDMKLREQSSQGQPRGVQLFKDILTTWNYDTDPKQTLLYSKAYVDLKDEISKDQGFLLQLMSAHLVKNKHRLISLMYPSTQLLSNYTKQEAGWLADLPSQLTSDQLNTIYDEVSQMKEVQAKPDSSAELDKISTIKISDLRTQNFEIPTKIHEDIFDSGITMLEHELPYTNGIAYIDFAVDVSNLDFDDVVLLPLFCRLLLEAGTPIANGVLFQQEIDINTGGIAIEPIVDEITATGSDGGYIVPTGQYMTTKIVVRSSCLASTGCVPMFLKVKQVLFETDVEQQATAIEILKKLIDDYEDDIQMNGYLFTSRRIQSQYGLPGYIREQWQGITQLLNLRRALIQARDDWTTLSQRLVLMADAIRKGNRNGMVLSLTGDKDSIKGAARGVEIFVVDELPVAAQVQRFPDFKTTVHPWYTKGFKSMTDEITAEGQNEAFIVPTRVNAVAKGGILFDAGEAVRGSHHVVLGYIGGFFLYDELRFGQGATSAWADIDIDTGSVVYQSEQDPDIAATLAVYEQAASWVNSQISGQTSLPVEAYGAVIGAIGAMDGTAMQPSTVGLTSMLQYLRQESKETRQKFRDEIIASNVADFKGMVERLGAWGKPSVAIITNQELYDAAVASGIDLVTCNYTGLSC